MAVDVKLDVAKLLDGVPSPHMPGIEGIGQGVEHNHEFYYYHVNKYIPRDRAVAVRSESNYCGRQHGDIGFIIIAWDGEEFRVIERPSPGKVQEKLKKFKGMTAQQAIDLAMEEERKLIAEEAARPKCRGGQNLMLFEKDQRPDECLTCYHKRIGKYKPVWRK